MLNKRYDGMDGHIQDIKNEFADCAVAVDPGTSTPSLTEPSLGLASDIANIGDGTLANAVKEVNDNLEDLQEAENKKGLTLLWSGQANSGTITLSDDITKYDFLLAVERYQTNQYGQCGYIPVELFINFFAPSVGTGNYGMLCHYDTYGVGLQYETNTSITLRGQSGSYLYYIYGIKIWS